MERARTAATVTGAVLIALTLQHALDRCLGSGELFATALVLLAAALLIYHGSKT